MRSREEVLREFVGDNFSSFVESIGRMADRIRELEAMQASQLPVYGSGTVTMTTEQMEEMRKAGQLTYTSEAPEALQEPSLGDSPARGVTDEMAEALSGLLSYRKHKYGCEIEQTDFCSCGMKEAADKARAALTASRGGG